MTIAELIDTLNKIEARDGESLSVRVSTIDSIVDIHCVQVVDDEVWIDIYNDKEN